MQAVDEPLARWNRSASVSTTESAADLSFSSNMRQLARAAAQAERARQRAALQHQRDAAKVHKQALADYASARADEAAQLAQETQQTLQATASLLARSLECPVALTAEELYRAELKTPIDLSRPSEVVPTAPRFIALLPGAKRKHKAVVAASKEAYQQALGAHARLVADYEAAVDSLARKMNEGEHDTIVLWLKSLVDRTLVEEIDAVSAEVGFSAASNHVVVDLELPEPAAIPAHSNFKYVKSADRIDAVALPEKKRREVYASLISQVVLKCIDTVFRGAVDIPCIENLTINGMLSSIDPGTGQEERVCLISVRIDKDRFNTLNLRRVQPEQCLRSLKASVSRAPTELVPVKPIIELDMVDPRFIATMDVASKIDVRANLMELSPGEFEGLITNLFSAMGLETRQTQASRDGGVDCVAFRTDPIFGGKVVIQAKRYKNVVGVSAVRDLYGTMQNEGAMKGILVTTSGYGKASFDFAKGKPIELLDGGNLLHLLAEHLSLEAKIIPPEEWVDG